MLEQSALVSTIIKSNYSNTERKIVSVPLQFGDLSVDILAKQFTKLNNNHKYRIYYLGPRFVNTQQLHKKYSYSQNSPWCQAVADRQIEKYSMDCKKIVNSFFINQKLRSNHHYKSGFYYRAFQGMNPTLDPTQQFVFNGCFQSGNLDCVIQYQKRQFDCFLKIDSNTRGHIQWYYFSVKNGSQTGKIKINVCNITKPGTLYEDGMQPYCFSKQAFKNLNQNWTQGSKNLTNVRFEQKAYNYTILQGKIPQKSVYCLSFDYDFEEIDDEVFFSYCIPYTYSQLLHDIKNLPKDYCRIHNFAKSLTGINIPMIQVTQKLNNNNTNNIAQFKQNIFITGRIHPAESNGSHTLKGFLQILCSSDKMAIDFRKRANIFIIPMINPDGVILGNSRSSVAGKDLNRMFQMPDIQIFPQISELKQLIGKFLKQKKILLYYDFHGHSRRKNTFFYGPQYPLSSPNYYKCRVLPKIIETFNNSFRYFSCSFSISQSKKSTGRACMFENYSIPFTYTIQSSVGFYYDAEKMKTFPFDKEAWKNVGASICQGTAKFLQAYQEYESFIRERRAVREKRKIDKMIPSRKNFRSSFDDINVDQQSAIQPSKSPLKIYYHHEQDGLFFKVMRQIKQSQVDDKKQPEANQAQNDLSSDDHDDTEDLQISKMKQFTNLIVHPEKRKTVKQTKNSGKRLRNNKNILHAQKVSEIEKQQKKKQQEDQISFFKQIMMRKIQSSHSNKRPKNFSSDIRPQINKLHRRVGLKTNGCTNRQQKSQQSEDKNDISLKLNLQDNTKGSTVSTMAKNGTQRINTTYRFDRNSEIHKTQFSQIQFPDNFQPSPSKSMSNTKTNFFRRIRRIKCHQQKQTTPLNCTEMMITKLQKQKNDQIKCSKIPNNNIQFKIEELMSNLQNRSKVLRQSVKCRQPQKPKQKQKQANLIFPTSFYTLKNQVNTEKRRKLTFREHNSYSRNNSTRKYEETPFGVKIFSNIQII